MSESSNDPAASAKRRTLVIAGNPNAGKTTLFNAITGARAKVANYPGVTVERRAATLELPKSGEVECVDLPGSYSLTSRSTEERIAVEAVLGLVERAPSALLVVCDATTLSRGLYLTTQLIDSGVPTVVALTMIDEARELGMEIDSEALERSLGAPFVRVVASTREGIDELLEQLDDAVSRNGPSAGDADDVANNGLGDAAMKAIEPLEAIFEAEHAGSTASARRCWAQWALLSSAEGSDLGLSAEAIAAIEDAHQAAEKAGVDLDLELIQARYRRIDEVVDEAIVKPAGRRTGSDRVDAVLTHRVWGMLVFVAVMVVVFEALFAWSEPMIEIVENLITYAQATAGRTLPEGPLADLVSDGVIAGVGNVLVFVPQIALLFIFISFLEDSGYLARVAFVIDRLMGAVGLHGKAFVPMLSGFACAVPAVMATRTMESRRDRLLTMLAIPFTSCSARLPIYVLVTAVVFNPDQRVLGVLSLGSVMLLAMYFLSVAAALGSAALLRRTGLRGPRPTLVLELPPYRVPLVRNVMRRTWERVKRFLLDAGTIILAFTIILWALLSFPKDDAITERFDRQRAEVEYRIPEAQRAERIAELDAQEAAEQLKISAAGRLGRAMEPALEPIGLDWRVGIGIIGAFAAREVFVSTLGIVFGIGDADEENPPLRQALGDAKWPDGRAVLTPLSGVSLMVFFVLACQCMSTIAVVRRESGSWRWPAFMFAYMTGLAYLAALAVFQIGQLLGWGGAT